MTIRERVEDGSLWELVAMIAFVVLAAWGIGYLAGSFFASPLGVWL